MNDFNFAVLADNNAADDNTVFTFAPRLTVNRRYVAHYNIKGFRTLETIGTDGEDHTIGYSDASR